MLIISWIFIHFSRNFLFYFQIEWIDLVFYVQSIELFVKMSAIDYLKKAVEYDMNGRKLESLKLYQQGISALLEICKSKTNSFFFVCLLAKIKLSPVKQNVPILQKKKEDICPLWKKLCSLFLNCANNESIKWCVEFLDLKN